MMIAQIKKLLAFLFGKDNEILRSRISFRGQAETPFILGIAIILSFLVFIGASLATTYPDAVIITSTDMFVFGGIIIFIAASCVVVTGIPCAAALVLGNLISFLTVGNTIMYALVFLPLSITTAYVLARLARGGG